MKMGEFREVSVSSSPLGTPSHSPNFNLLRQNFFHGDFSSSNRFSLNSSSDYSLSSSFSNGFSYSDDSSSSPFASPPFNGIVPYKHNHASSSPVAYHHHDSLFHKDHDKPVDDLGLSEDLYRMKIKDDFDPLGSIPESDHFILNPPNNGVVVDGGFVSGGFPCGFFRTPKDSCDSWLNNNNNSGFDQSKNEDQRRNMFGNNNPLQIQDSIANSRQQIGWPSYSNSNVGQEIFGSGLSRGGGGGIREYSAYSPPQQQPEISYNHHSYRTTTTSDMLPLFCQGTTQGYEPFSPKESFFMEGKSFDHQRSVGGGITRGLMSDHGNTTEICHQSLPNMCDIQGYVYLMAKDQHGCRFLQRIFDEGTSVDAMIIFNEVIAHVVELMMDPFGNYLMQKLLDVCTEEQRTQIVLVATAEPGQLIRISLNAYG